jgi:hypothetical protein
MHNGEKYDVNHVIEYVDNIKFSDYIAENNKMNLTEYINMKSFVVKLLNNIIVQTYLLDKNMQSSTQDIMQITIEKLCNDNTYCIDYLFSCQYMEAMNLTKKMCQDDFKDIT